MLSEKEGAKIDEQIDQRGGQEVTGKSMSRRELGARGEAFTRAYLSKKGWEILEQNAWSGQGELDLVASHSEEAWGQWRRVVVFVEVKARVGGEHAPQMSVTRSKRERIVRLAKAWLGERGYLEETAVRFDVMALTWSNELGTWGVNHLEGAFDGEGACV